MSAATGGLTSLNFNISPRALALDGADNLYAVAPNDSEIAALPYAFVNQTSPAELPAAAGIGSVGTSSVPVVLPKTANLAGPFLPAFSEDWLDNIIIMPDSGIVNFNVAQNTGASDRSATLSVLGAPITITQASPSSGPPPSQPALRLAVTARKILGVM